MSENPNDRYPKVGTPVSTGVVWATLEPNRAYSPFAVYAWLEHRGDFERAARMLRQEGFGGEPIAVSTIRIVESTTITIDSNPIYSPVDPGPVPLEMLRIPGFVSEVMDLCLDTAPYPNHVMAFCGALTEWRKEWRRQALPCMQRNEPDAPFKPKKNSDRKRSPWLDDHGREWEPETNPTHKPHWDVTPALPKPPGTKGDEWKDEDGNSYTDKGTHTVVVPPWSK